MKTYLNKITSILTIMIMVISFASVIITVNAAGTVDYTDENGINYTFTSETTAEVTAGECYIMDVYDEWYWSYPIYTPGSTIESDDDLYTITIPSEIKGRTVTGIGEYAIIGDYKEVYVPAAVTYIGECALGYDLTLSIMGGGEILSDGSYIDWDFDFDDIKKIYDFVIYGYTDTVTEEYALKNNFTFVSLDKVSTKGLKYKVKDDGTAEITECNSSAVEIEILSEIDGYTVTSIGDNAFRNRTKLEKIIIPDTVTSIGNYAFTNTNLTSVIIPESVTSIGKYAFSSTNITNVVIPESITEISSYAFYNCKNLTNITIPDSVTSISDYAFAYCNSLKSIIIPKSVTSISDFAFAYMGLVDIIIPDSVTSIGDYLFYKSENLKSIVVECNITSLGNCMFYGCTSLESVVLPDSVTNLGSRSFYGCSSLASIVISENVTSIGDYTFYGCIGLENIIIPESVTNIGDYAFAYTGLIDMIIPDSVTSIGKYAFYYCINLKSVKIGNYIKEIGISVFEYCENLTNVVIGDNAENIGVQMFWGCINLKNITIPGSVTNIGSYALGYTVHSQKITDMKIYGAAGSTAEIYANANNITFINLTENLIGDVNCDGKITISDLIFLAKHLSGKAQPTPQGKINAKCNSATVGISGEDLLALIKYFIGEIKSLPTNF